MTPEAFTGRRSKDSSTFEKFPPKKHRKGPGRQTTFELTDRQRSVVQGRIHGVIRNHFGGAVDAPGGSLGDAVDSAIRQMGQTQYLARGVCEPRRSHEVVRKEIMHMVVSQRSLAWSQETGLIGQTAAVKKRGTRKK